METGYAAVVKMAPVIDLYDEDMNLLNSVDISDIPVIERKVKDIEKSREASAPGTLTVYYQFGDSYYSDGKLYILCFTVNDDPADNMKNLGLADQSPGCLSRDVSSGHQFRAGPPALGLRPPGRRPGCIGGQFL